MYSINQLVVHCVVYPPSSPPSWPWLRLSVPWSSPVWLCSVRFSTLVFGLGCLPMLLPPFNFVLVSLGRLLHWVVLLPGPRQWPLLESSLLLFLSTLLRCSMWSWPVGLPPIFCSTLLMTPFSTVGRFVLKTVFPPSTMSWWYLLFSTWSFVETSWWCLLISVWLWDVLFWNLCSSPDCVVVVFTNVGDETMFLLVSISSRSSFWELMVCLSTLISVDVSSGLYRGFGMDFGDGIFGFIDLLDWSSFCSSLCTSYWPSARRLLSGFLIC